MAPLILSGLAWLVWDWPIALAFLIGCLVGNGAISFND